MFKQRFVKLCADRGMSPAAVCKEIGLSNSAYSKWTDTTIPRQTVLVKCSEFFGVSIEYLKGEEDIVESPVVLDMNALTEQEQTLIALFRETTEEGRLEMISAFMDIKSRVEKKVTGEDSALVG